MSALDRDLLAEIERLNAEIAELHVLASAMTLNAAALSHSSHGSTEENDATLCLFANIDKLTALTERK